MTPFAGFGAAELALGDDTPAIFAGPLYASAITIDSAGNTFIASGRTAIP